MQIIRFLYLFIWVIFLPEFIKNCIVFIVIWYRYDSKKALRWVCDIDLLQLLNRTIRLSTKNIIGPNVTLDGNITIGRHSYINGYSEIIASKKYPITIGNFCCIARNCFIISYSHHNLKQLSISTNIHANIKNTEYGAPISIGNDVWIGANVTILPWVTLWDGVVIGAGSIVLKDIPAYAVAVGNPAKVVKYRFNESTIQKLLQGKWWEKDMKLICEQFSEFTECSLEHK